MPSAHDQTGNPCGEICPFPGKNNQNAQFIALHGRKLAVCRLSATLDEVLPRCDGLHLYVSMRAFHKA